MDHRVLLLSYYFPPAGGPGVQRTLKFVKHFPACGWRPVVLTVRQGAYPARDPSLAEDVPPAAQVYRTRSLDPHHLYARLTGRADEAVDVGSVEGRETGRMGMFARWIRANLFLPDARVGWVPFAVWRGRRLLAEEDIDAVLTSGPPHSTHLIGAALEWSTGVSWVADFRDPWTDINYYQELPHTWAARRLDAALERMVLRRASAVTTVSPSWRELLARKTPQPDPERFSVVQNGFDPDDIPPGNAVPSEEKFEVTHVGSLYASRNPSALWRALQSLRADDRIPDLRIRLVGTVDPNVRRALRAHDLREITEFVSYVPHAKAVAYMQRAGLLVLSIEEFPQAEGMITGKIYEYLASGRPVVGVGPPNGDAAAVLRTSGGGQFYGRDDTSGLAHFIQDHYAAWVEGRPRSGASPERIRRYRRRAQTEHMAAVLNEVTH